MSRPRTRALTVLLIGMAFALQAAASPLHDAVKAGDTPALQRALAGEAALDERDGDEASALFLAAQAGNLEQVKLLLAKGAAIEIGGSYGRTPLMVASGAGHLDVIEYLLAQGADMDSPGHNDRWTCPMAAAEHNQEAVVRFFVAKGADIHKRNANGDTVLSIAAGTSGSVGLVRYLIGLGADFQSPDNYGFTPLYRARQTEDSEIEALLEERIAAASNPAVAPAPAAAEPAVVEAPAESVPEPLAYSCDIMMATVEMVLGTLEATSGGEAMPCALMNSIGNSLTQTRLYMDDAARNDRCDVAQEDAEGYRDASFDRALESGLANCTE